MGSIDPATRKACHNPMRNGMFIYDLLPGHWANKNGKAGTAAEIADL
jgi:hypothetical protein